jgi:peptidoglycan/LPS O-acetylase OafA/YrhL
MIFAAWGTTFYFSWYSVISNKPAVDDMLKTVTFNLFVSAAVYTVPVFFFISGFLQTHSFLHRNERDYMQMFTFKNLAKYYFRKIFRFMPLNILSLLLLVKMMPYLGNGPVWNNFSQLVEPCNDKWWTNILWINNLYPQNYDDRCLPWTWFVPCYIQLSLLLPIILAIYIGIEN